MIFGRGGGRLDPRMSHGGESFGVRPLFIAAPIVIGACLILLFSVDERGRLGEKISCRQHSLSGASHRVVSLSKTQFILVLVLVQPRKTRPDISEKVLTGR